MKHVNDLSGPPEIGRYYLVPTVTAIWNDISGEWPVIGPLHNDRQHLKFDRDHYHLDTRFMPDLSGRRFCPQDFWLTVHASPVMRTCSTPGLYNRRQPSRSVAGVYPRKWLCKRSAKETSPVFVGTALDSRYGGENFKAHFDYWAGHQCKHDGKGWVCPHRNVPLASQPVVDGVITCPLHALMIDAATGRVLSRDEMETRRQS